jgi:hypothetical protein
MRSLLYCGQDKTVLRRLPEAEDQRSAEWNGESIAIMSRIHDPYNTLYETDFMIHILSP